MSKTLPEDQGGYTKRELLFIRWFILILYALIIFSVIAIGAFVAIITKNPFCGVYGILPAALLLPMHKIIDRVFPPLSDKQSDSMISKVKRIRAKKSAQPDAVSPPA